MYQGTAKSPPRLCGTQREPASNMFAVRMYFVFIFGIIKNYPLSIDEGLYDMFSQSNFLKHFTLKLFHIYIRIINLTFLQIIH